MLRRIFHSLILYLVFMFVLFWASCDLFAAKKKMLKLQGEYLAYSYDHNQIYGENVFFDLSDLKVSARFIRIDVSARAFVVYGHVKLDLAGEEKIGEEFFFDPSSGKGYLIRYRDLYEIINMGHEEKETEFVRNESLEEITLTKIKKSFLYFTCPEIEIYDNFEVYGYNVTLFLEGLPSVGFKKFKLSEGFQQRSKGFSLDRIWYSRSQGITGKASFLYEKQNLINSLSQVRYEERSVLKNYLGEKRQVDLLTSTTINPNEKMNLGLTGNYNSSGLWNTSFWLNNTWSEKVTTNLDFSYNKPINYKGEAWIGLQSTINGGKFGNIALAGRYEFQNQILGNFTYGNIFFNSISLMLTSSYSRVKIGKSDFSEILSGGISLAYSPKIFNIATDYYLNYDLFGNQLLSQPQLQIGINPISFYGGLLTAGLTNIFIYNHLKRGDEVSFTYSNNMIFNLSTAPLYVQKSLSLDFTLALEQFLEKQNRNFTSNGIIINLRKEIIRGIFIEGLFSIQSRRKTRGWLIEGTTSQDFSTVFRMTPSNDLNGWISFSYDPKNRQWRQSYADLSLSIIKNWKFHSQLNYDFLLKKINNVDLYLIREAGRAQLRFIWRSLSKQFLVELSPR